MALISAIKLCNKCIDSPVVDVLRQKCSSVELIKELVKIMSSGNDAEASQACRALGNICFDNG